MAKPATPLYLNLTKPSDKVMLMKDRFVVLLERQNSGPTSLWTSHLCAEKIPTDEIEITTRIYQPLALVRDPDARFVWARGTRPKPDEWFDVYSQLPKTINGKRVSHVEDGYYYGEKWVPHGATVIVQPGGFAEALRFLTAEKWVNHPDFDGAYATLSELLGG